MAAASKKRTQETLTTDPFAPYFAIGESMATLLHPFAEVVLHDLRTGRIVRIWNSFSDRQAGDLSNLKGAQDLFPDDQLILGPYEKALPSQGRTKSITAALRGPDGDLIGFLCTNLDVTVLDNAVAMMSAFASPELKRPETLYRTDLQQHVSYLVRDYSLQINKPIDNLTRAERVDLIELINRDGLFQARNAVAHVAKAMKISRASVYNLLSEVNRRAEDESEAEPRPPMNERIAAAARIASAQSARERERRPRRAAASGTPRTPRTGKA